MIFRFIKLIPAFYRLFRDSEMEPEDIRFSLLQYQTVICELTDGLMSKLNYYATDIINLVRDRFCDHCDLLEEHEEHEKLLTRLGYHWTGSGETLALCKKKDGEQK